MLRNGSYVRIVRKGGPDYSSYFGNVASCGDWGAIFSMSDGSSIAVETAEWNNYIIETLDCNGDWLSV